MEHIKGFLVDGLLAILALTFPILNNIFIASVRSFTEVHEFLVEVKDSLNIIVVLLVIIKFGVEIYKLLKKE